MQDKCMRQTHISERKFREILRLFRADLTVTQIAGLSGLNRNTVNRILALVRARITFMAQSESAFCAGEIEVGESYFCARRMKGRRGREASGKTLVFGIKKRGDKVFTQVVKNCSAATLTPIIKALASEDSTIYSDEWKACDGLVNVGYKKHYRVRRSEEVFANGKAHVNGV